MNPQLDSRLALLFGRRSTRDFRPGEVDDATLRTLLEAAMAAPSAVGKDPWRFVVVRDRAMLGRLAGVLSNGEMLHSANLCLAVCGDLDAVHDHQISYLLQDCAAAIENLLLAAHALGLGACWLGVHPREHRIKAVRELLALPAQVIPVACIALGHPVEQKESRTRYNPAYVHRERW
jgi:nitroreductase